MSCGITLSLPLGGFRIAAQLLTAPIPVRIISGHEPLPPPPPGTNYFAWASGACIAAAIGLLAWRVRSLRRRPAEDRTFHLLARRLSVTSREQVLLREMARIHGDISPLAMLVSAAAFTRCRDAMGASVIGYDSDALASLSRKLSA